MPLEEHLQGENSKQMQVDTASTDPMRPREGIAYMLQDPENEPLEAEEVDDDEIDNFFEAELENPPILKCLMSTLAQMAGKNEVLPTRNKLKITENLKSLAALARTTLQQNAKINPDLKAGIEPIINFIIQATQGDEYQQVSGRGQNPCVDTIFDEILRLKLHRGDSWDPEIELRNAHKEFGEWGGVNPSIEPSTTFTTMDPQIMEKIFGAELGPDDGCFLYSRHFNPTSLFYGLRLAAMEGTEIAYPTASGMSAIMVTLFHLLNPGDRLVASTTVYGGTHALFENILPKKLQVDVELVKPSDTDKFIEAITPGTKVVYVETEANPTLEIADLARIADRAHEVGATFVVDNTFTPLTFSPKLSGADVVLYSITKFIGGRSDSICGGICCDHALLMQLMSLTDGMLMLGGPVTDPKVAAQMNLYLNDLALRIKEHSSRALMYAHKLEKMGFKVCYPGLESHPQHELAKLTRNKKFGYGGMMTIELETMEQAERFVRALQQSGGGLNAVSLGYSDTLTSISGVSTSSEIPEEERQRIGVAKGLVRLSVGFEGDMETEWSKISRAAHHATAR